MERLLIDYLPPVLQGVREFGMIMDIEQEEISRLWGAIEAALNDQFIQVATEYGISRWESILGIVPKGTDTLDDRRFRTLTLLSDQRPYTLRSLCQRLDNLCGTDGYSINLQHNDYLLIVKVNLTARSKYEAVEDLLKRTVPANMQIDLTLKYNTHEVLSNFAHNELARYTHEQLRNEVITHA